MKNEFDYLIVGAGPAGLQLGYFFEKSGYSYAILEANSEAGSFFKTYPIHRKLLSINKINNFYTEEEFNMRHDWNSLLSDDLSMRFKHYSKTLYPDADELFCYLKDYADNFDLNIIYDTRIKNVTKSNALFTLRSSSDENFFCKRLIIATGAIEPYVPDDIEGIEHAIQYTHYPMESTSFVNKRVAIVGKGNSAFEVADHLAEKAAFVHIFARTPVKHAWQTHYVGDLRAINNSILDMYQLKSLHATVGFEPTKIRKNTDGTLDITVKEALPHWETPGTTITNITYDYLICCTGWRFVDQTMFDDTCCPEVDKLRKYPKLSSSWESSVEGMFFIGTAMAARDRRSASGFIHGFRYNVRSLFQLLNKRYHKISLPSSQYPLSNPNDLNRFANFIITRVSTTDALYQVNAFLGDVIVFRDDAASYYRELPMDLVRSDDSPLEGDEIVTVTLEYGFDRYSSEVSALDFIHPADQHDTTCSAFLHPVLRRYNRGELIETIHLGESLVGRYDHYDYEENIDGVHKSMVKNFLNRIRHCVHEEFSETKYPDGVFRAWTPEEVSTLKDVEIYSDAPCRFAVYSKK